MRARERQTPKNAIEIPKNQNTKKKMKYIKIMEEGIRADSFTTTVSQQIEPNTKTHKKVKDTVPQAEGQNRPKNKRDETKSALEQPDETEP